MNVRLYCTFNKYISVEFPVPDDRFAISNFSVKKTANAFARAVKMKEPWSIFRVGVEQLVKGFRANSREKSIAE